VFGIVVGGLVRGIFGIEFTGLAGPGATVSTTKYPFRFGHAGGVLTSEYAINCLFGVPFKNVTLWRRQRGRGDTEKCKRLIVCNY
jgi:hypothetical protein